MKKMFSCILAAAVLLVLLTLVAHAEAFANVKMNPVEGTYKKGDQFSVRFYVADIGNEYGLALAEFKVHFDKETLKFVSSSAGHPAAWNFENDVAEIWEKLDESSGDTFIFAALNPLNNQGVKTDGEIYLEMTFELLKDVEETEFLLTNILFADDFVSESKLENKTFTVHFDGTKSEGSDVEPMPVSQESNGNNQESGTNQSGTEVNESGSESVPQDPSNTWKIVLCVAAGVLVLAAAVIVAVVVSRKKKQ